jgi:hypothetical protein
LCVYNALDVTPLLFSLLTNGENASKKVKRYMVEVGVKTQVHAERQNTGVHASDVRMRKGSQGRYDHAYETRGRVGSKREEPRDWPPAAGGA